MIYIPALDGLRAVAILLVVAFHVFLKGFSGGFLGVNAFFVLSGFLITSILLTPEGKTDYGNFIRRRVFRLYPALLIFLAVISISLLAFREHNVAPEVIPSALYVSNYARLLTGNPDVLRHTWSLCVEFHFYLFWPFVVAALTRLPRRKAFARLMSCYLAFTAWKIVAYHMIGWQWSYNATDTRVGALALGAAISFLPQVPLRHGRLLDGIAAVFLIVAFLNARYYTQMTLLVFEPLAEIGCAILVYRLSTGHGPFVAPLSFGPLRKIGNWSYGIYLWHYPIAFALRDSTDPIQTLLVTLGFSTSVAAISHEYLEMRIRNSLRTRRTPLRSR